MLKVLKKDAWRESYRALAKSDMDYSERVHFVALLDSELHQCTQNAIDQVGVDKAEEILGVDIDREKFDIPEADQKKEPEVKSSQRRA